MSELKRHKKSDAIKWILITLAVIILAVCVTAAMTKGFTDWNPYGWLKTEPPADQDEDKSDLNDELVITPDVQNAGVRLSAARVAANNGRDTQADSGYMVTATITDQDGKAIDVETEYSLSWADTTVSDIVPSDFVSVVKGDNDYSWLLQCKKAFEHQIVFTVRVVGHSDLSASLTIDYSRRLMPRINASVAGNEATIISPGTVFRVDLPEKSLFVASSSLRTIQFWLVKEVFYGTGTITPITNGSFKVSVTDEFYNVVKGSSFFKYTLIESSDVVFPVVAGNMDDVVSGTGFSSIHGTNMAVDALYAAIPQANYHYKVEVNLSANGEGYSFEYFIRLTVPGSTASNIELNYSELVF